MAAIPKKKPTPAEYLAIERKAEFKSEYFNGEMFAMAGARFRHVRAVGNLVGELHTKLRRTNCVTLSSDMRVHIQSTGLYTYPDVTIVCGEPVFEDPEEDILLNPRVIIEVLSASTERYDRGTKFTHYQSIPTLMEYVLVSPWEPQVERYYRQNDGTWSLTTFRGLKATLAFQSVKAKIPLKAIYANVKLNPPTLGLLHSTDE